MSPTISPRTCHTVKDVLFPSELLHPHTILAKSVMTDYGGSSLDRWIGFTGLWSRDTLPRLQEDSISTAREKRVVFVLGYNHNTGLTVMDSNTGEKVNSHGM